MVEIGVYGRGEMKMEEIRMKARVYGVKTRGVKKADLIREIQRAEGNFDCFDTATEYCDQWDCCFREDCLSSAKS